MENLTTKILELSYKPAFVLLGSYFWSSNVSIENDPAFCYNLAYLDVENQSCRQLSWQQVITSEDISTSDTSRRQPYLQKLY